LPGGPQGYDVAASELLDPDFSPAFRLMEGSYLAASGTLQPRATNTFLDTSATLKYYWTLRTCELVAEKGYMFLVSLPLVEFLRGLLDKVGVGQSSVRAISLQ
jgi:hypothetical protein